MTCCTILAILTAIVTAPVAIILVATILAAIDDHSTRNQ